MEEGEGFVQTGIGLKKKNITKVRVTSVSSYWGGREGKRTGRAGRGKCLPLAAPVLKR